MPAALQIDWEKVKDAYIQGVSSKELCKRFGVNSGTLGARANRGGWVAAKKAGHLVMKQLKQPRREITELVMTVQNEAARGLQARGQAMRERLARDCERALAVLESLEVVGLENMELRERTLKMLTDRTMRTFGMEDKGAGQVVLLGLARSIIDKSKSIDLPKDST